MDGFVKIKGTKEFGGKKYTLADSFVSKETANRLKARYKKQGYLVRIYQEGGVMHSINRYHVYKRKK